MVAFEMTCYPYVVMTWREQCRARELSLGRRMRYLTEMSVLALSFGNLSLMVEADVLKSYLLEGDYLVPYAEWDYGGEA